MLTTLQKAKTLLQIPQEDDTQDFFIEALLLASSSAIEDYCRRSFGYASYTGSKFGGTQGDYLILPNYPIHAVSSLQFGSLEPEELDSFEVISDNGVLYRSDGWQCGERGITVSYTAGYVLPGGEAIEGVPKLPDSLEMACILYAQILQRMPSVSAERVGDISVSYANEGEGLPFAVKSLINPHRRWL